MSANNYTFCPRCTDEKRLKIEELETTLDEEYGRLSKEEWLNNLELEKDKRTLREYYGVWMDGKESPPLFFVRYSCSCENCRFEYSFTHEEVVSIEVKNDGQ